MNFNKERRWLAWEVVKPLEKGGTEFLREFPRKDLAETYRDAWLDANRNADNVLKPGGMVWVRMVAKLWLDRDGDDLVELRGPSVTAVIAAYLLKKKSFTMFTNIVVKLVQDLPELEGRSYADVDDALCRSFAKGD